MKKLFLLLFIAGLYLPTFGQNRYYSNAGNAGNAMFFKKLSNERSVHPTIKKASIGISRNLTIRDSLVSYTRSFERAVLKRKPAGNIKPELVKIALRKYPGNSDKAVKNRLNLYKAKGVGRKGSKKRRRRR